MLKKIVLVLGTVQPNGKYQLTLYQLNPESTEVFQWESWPLVQ